MRSGSSAVRNPNGYGNASRRPVRACSSTIRVAETGDGVRCRPAATAPRSPNSVVANKAARARAGRDPESKSASHFCWIALVRVAEIRRRWRHVDAFLDEFARFFRRGFAVDVALFGFAVVNLARLFRETRGDIVGVVLDVFAYARHELAHLAEFVRRRNGRRAFAFALGAR